MKAIAVLDLSWEMHKGRIALDMLSVIENGKPRPTGHVYMTCNDVASLSQGYDEVILAVDSRSSVRKSIISSYKEGRKSTTGDSYVDYSIYNDLYNILSLCTLIPNVFYIKEKEYEADDIIASCMKALGSKSKLSCYFNDNDIMQTDANYFWFTAVRSSALTDRREYIRSKYGIDEDFLPIWAKVMSGDSSDKIPNLFPRLPSNLKNKIVTDLKDTQNLDDFYKYLESNSGLFSSAWIAKIFDDSGKVKEPLRTQIYKNHSVICPLYLPSDKLVLKKTNSSKEEVRGIINQLQLFSYYDLVKQYL